MFPVWLDLEKRRCLVVGGGAVALRKIVGLIDAGARVVVIAPQVVPEVASLAEDGRLLLERRDYEQGDAARGFAIVFAATDQREVNRQVSVDAAAANVFVNVADDPELCSFQLAGRVRRGSLEVAVNSGGGAPFLVRRLREALDKRLGPEWAEWVESAVQFRHEVRSRCASGPDQEACFDRFVAGTLDTERLSVRVPSPEELEGWVAAATITGAVPTRIPTSTGPEGDPGFVSLVGAGPGCAGLLTLRGRARLMAADAVVYDRLAAGALPTELPARVELHGVGKEAGHHPVPQEQINELLIRLARAGKRVVRLKGGDPYVFGRGGEEAAALEAAGLRFEVVPGVTSGIAATALAGIPVTHRREAVQVTLLTAHECAKSDGPQVRWDLLARDPHATLVGYMGMSALPSVVERLLAAGMSADTPAAVVQEGATSAQRSVVATISTVVALASAAGVRAPALFVIGPTVSHANTLNWHSRLPLAGERLAVPARATALIAALEEAGAETVPVPLPITPAARVVLGARPLTGCAVRSAAEVESFDEECRGADPNGRWTAWCLGGAAAERARQRGWRCRDVGGDEESRLVERLVEELAGATR